LQVLFRAWFDLAEERSDVKDALLELRAWLNERLAGEGPGEFDRPLEVREAGAVFEKVLAPALDRRVFNVRAGGSEPAEVGLGAGDRRLRDRRPPDLQLIAKRARWKCDAVRWAVERRRMEADGAEYATQIRPHDDALRARRDELEDCFAWMLDPYRRFPEDERMLQIADCYENVALAAECTLALIAAGALEPAPPPDLLYQLAEAQSALLAGLEAVDLRSDSDQRDLFVWLKNQTLRHRIYVDRHMKLDDPADFTASRERAERLRTLSATLMDRKQAMRRRVHLLNKVRFHLRKLADSEGAFGNDLAAIALAVQEWKEIGYPLHDRHLVDMLESLPDAIPEGTPLPPLVNEVLAQREQQEQGDAYGAPSEGDGARRESAIERASELVRGMRALMFSGPEDAAARAELERVLGLAQVRWIALDAEPGIEALEAAIGAPDVDLVLLAVRLPEMAYAEFKRLCRDRGAPFVRLPGGAGAHEVAQQLMRQIGRMLHGRATERAGV
jgi:hypothetical protein